MPGSEQVADRIAICAAKARYCRMLDTKDWDGFTNLFTEDYELDVSDGTGMAVIKGRDAAMAMVRASIGAAKTAHQVHSPEIALDGDEARVIWALQDRVIWADDHSLTGYGHYHERWVRRAGEWKIAALKLTRLFIEMQTPTAS
jgi:hypothetical protein